MENKNVAFIGIGALAFYYLIARSKGNEDEQLYSFVAGQSGVGAGSTFTLLENSGNTVSNINAPVYETKKETTILNYSPTNNTAGSPASGSSGGSSIIPLSPQTSQALATYSAQDAQLKKSQAMYGLDNSAGGSYKFPAPTKSTYVPAQPTISVPINSTSTNSTSTKKESSTGSSGGGVISRIVSWFKR
jgi:hypothetical protein